MLSSKNHVCRQRPFQPTATADPIHCRDDRLVEIWQLLQPSETPYAIVTVNGLAFGGGFEIPSGAEKFLAGAGNDRHPKFGIISKPGKDLPQFPTGRDIDRIRLRPIQGHLKHSPSLLSEHTAATHRHVPHPKRGLVVCTWAYLLHSNPVLKTEDIAFAARLESIPHALLANLIFCVAVIRIGHH